MEAVENITPTSLDGPNMQYAAFSFSHRRKVCIAAPKSCKCTMASSNIKYNGNRAWFAHSRIIRFGSCAREKKWHIMRKLYKYDMGMFIYTVYSANIKTMLYTILRWPKWLTFSFQWQFTILNSAFRILNSDSWINLIDDFIYYIIHLCKTPARVSTPYPTEDCT